MRMTLCPGQTFVAEQKRVRAELKAIEKAEYKAAFEAELKVALERARNAPRPDCPDCGRDGYMVPVVYGLPGKVTSEVARLGELAMGGCMMGEVRWACKKCCRRFTEEDMNRVSNG